VVFISRILTAAHFQLEVLTILEDNSLPSTFSFSYQEHPTFATNIPFSSYDFVSLHSLNRLPPEDISFLGLKGCLHVPNRSNLVVLLRKYFLHVHPCLPVLDEAEIWRMYDGNYSQNRSPQKLSLLVLQAILFASSAVGPPHNQICLITYSQKANGAVCSFENTHRHGIL
jgi:hypothetical protein